MNLVTHARVAAVSVVSRVRCRSRARVSSRRATSRCSTRTFRNPYSVQATAGVERTFQQLHAGGRLRLSQRARSDEPRRRQRAGVDRQAGDAQRALQADATRPTPAGARRLPQHRDARKPRPELVSRPAGQGRALDRAAARHGVLYAGPRARTCSTTSCRKTAAIWRRKKARAERDVRHNLSVGATWTLPGTGLLWRDWSLSGIRCLPQQPARIRLPGAMIATARRRTTRGPAAGTRRRTDGYQNLDLALTRRIRARSRGLGTARRSVQRAEHDQLRRVRRRAALAVLTRSRFPRFPKRRLQLAAMVRF